VAQTIPESPALTVAWRKGDPRDPTPEFAPPAIAPDGTIWVPSGAENKIWVFDKEGNLVDSFGTPGHENGQFDFVYRGPGSTGDSFGGVAIGPDGSFWVSDTGNLRVEYFDRNRNYVRQLGGPGTGAGQFAEPTMIGVDKYGNVYVLDTIRQDIQMFDSAGNYLKTFAEGLTGYALSVQPSGWVYTNALPDGRPGLTEYKGDTTVQGALDISAMIRQPEGISTDFVAGSIYIGGSSDLLMLDQLGNSVFLWPMRAEAFAVTPLGDAVYVTAHDEPELIKYWIGPHP
jgi:6-bladed beta-propeller